MLNRRIFVLGAGFIGKPLSIHLNALGYSVEVSVRNEEKVLDLKALKIPVHVFSVGDEWLDCSVFESDVLILCYPIGSRSNPDGAVLNQTTWIEKHFPNAALKQVVLTSSTSVYPDGFGLVNENFDQALKDHGSIQLAYEKELQRIYGEKLTVCRLAGLLGADRQPGRFLAGRSDVPNPNSPVNMVHQLDVVRFITAAVSKDVRGEIFNLCHDSHPTREAYFTRAALELGLQPPTFSAVQIDNPKLVDNTKSKMFFKLEYTNPIV